MGWYCALLLALLTLLSLAPWTVRFTVKSKPRWQGRVDVVWAGSIHWHRELLQPAPRSATRQASTPGEPRSPHRSRRPALQDILSVVNHLRRYLVRFVAQTEVRKVQIHCRAGLDDPCDTAILYGTIAPLLLLFNGCDNCTMAFEAQMEGDGFELDSRGEVLLRPIRYLIVVLRLVVDPTSWKLTRALLKK